MIVMVGPPARELDSWVTDFHLKCVTPIVRRFERRMFSKTISRSGVIYVDPDPGGEIAMGDNGRIEGITRNNRDDEDEVFRTFQRLDKLSAPRISTSRAEAKIWYGGRGSLTLRSL